MSRFKNPKELMANIGLVPSENSSGSKIRRGRITKTGNIHGRRVLVEAAWTCRMWARKTGTILKRQDGLPKSICDISWNALDKIVRKILTPFQHMGVYSHLLPKIFHYDDYFDDDFE